MDLKETNFRDNPYSKNRVIFSSKLVSTLLALIVPCFIIFFTFPFFRGFYQEIQSRYWLQVPCTILQSSLTPYAKNRSLYNVSLKYQYIYQNNTYESDVYTLQKFTVGEELSKAQKLADAYPVGKQTFCYVNPHKPSEAVLALVAPWGALVIILPATIITLIFCSRIYKIWFCQSKDNVQPIEKSKADNYNQKTERNKQLNKAWQIAIGLILTAFGFGLGYGMLFYPLIMNMRAKNWSETPCRIISATVGTHRTSRGGSTYSINILYEYAMNGKTYQSQRYGFMRSSNRNYNEQQDLADSYLHMKNPVCFVNPNDPSSAVFIRDVKFDVIGLIPLISIVFGVRTIFVAFRSENNILPA